MSELQPSGLRAAVIPLEQKRFELDYRVSVLFEVLAQMVRFAKSLKPGAKYIPSESATEEPLIDKAKIAFYRGRLDELKTTSRGQAFF